MPTIEINHVSKRYPNGTLALDDILLDIQAGEIVGVLGPNGAGKTTLIKLMIGLIFPTQGKIRIMGMDMLQAEMSIKTRSGVVHQNNAFDDLLSVGDNLLIHGAFYGLTGKQVRERSASLLDAFGLASKWKSPLQHLSGGECRKLQIVRALLNQPTVLFLDEPSTSLDVQAKRTFHEMMRQQAQERGITIVWTTHDLAEIENVCNRVAVLKTGRLIALELPAMLGRLVGGDLVTITLATGTEQLRLCEQLRQEGYQADALDKSKLTLRLHNAEEELMPLVSQWLQAGYAVRAVLVKHTSLEDAYLYLTEGRTT